MARKGKKVQVFNRTEGRCAFCGEVLDLDSFTMDHITPQAYGGSSSVENLVAACFACNNRKRDKTVEEYRRAYRLDEFWIEIHEGKKLRGHSDVVWTTKGVK